MSSSASTVSTPGMDCRRADRRVVFASDLSIARGRWDISPGKRSVSEFLRDRVVRLLGDLGDVGCGGFDGLRGRVDTWVVDVAAEGDGEARAKVERNVELRPVSSLGSGAIRGSTIYS